MADAEQERPLFGREVAGKNPRIGIIDVDARNVADRRYRARTALRPPCRDAMIDRVVKDDVTRIVAVRAAVLEIEIRETVRKNLAGVRVDTSNSTEIFDIRAGACWRDDDRIEELVSTEFG